MLDDEPGECLISASGYRQDSGLVRHESAAHSAWPIPRTHDQLDLSRSSSKPRFTSAIRTDESLQPYGSTTVSP